ncbi:MAG: hypothetical protein JRG96_02200 [Deltaproteobacteria bacterium]|nr:hypothetical protein [Deltaproteobacteria bacterium]MBW2420586.1 hypothetical protein [Deltaproteobacteria bacterium]
MQLRDGYTGPFDPAVGLADFSRQTLAHLGREYLLNGHLQDRVGLPLVAARFGGEAYVQFAIEEWMGASPIYSLRMQRAMGFEGHEVGTVFKNLQLEIGAPQQFMDFQFRLDSPQYGEFWLPHCGALLDVEPFGEERVKLMCHDIEDPTFDATAAATHPCMKMRPIHRPPREPAGRYPHCRWAVFIGDEAEPYEQHPNLELVGAARAATVSIEVPARDAEPGGWPDYAGPFDPGFQLEDLSHRALVIVSQEFALQSHLLARAFMLCAAQRLDNEAASELGAAQWTGIAALTAERLRETMGIEGDDIEAVAKVFQIHPCFLPRSYVDFHVELTGARSARIALRDCPALEEGDSYSWLAGLGAAPHPALDAIACAVNPRARCVPVSDCPGARFAWDVSIDPSAEPRPPPQELALAKISRGATFRFEQRRALRS